MLRRAYSKGGYTALMVHLMDWNATVHFEDMKRARLEIKREYSVLNL